MRGVGFEILARTPVPKLPLSYPPRYVFSWDLVEFIHLNSFGAEFVVCLSFLTNYP